MIEIPQPRDLTALMADELEGLELKGPGSRERLLASSPELLDLVLNSRNVVEFLTKLSKNDKTAGIKDYDHVVDFFNAKARRHLKRKNQLAGEARAKTLELLHPEKK
ncbi:hypothetical protein HZA44_04530 [Candidatus Peregrinibacteria bacterium]|nr:hypothetical protein [Candidatus Peregrinibacteria bacterium]